MAITLPSGFIITNTEPVDSRLSLANQAARLALSTANVYEGLVVYQQDTNELYVLIDASTPSSTASWQLVGSNIATGSFATTGSNTFTGDQIISGSLIVTGSITGSLFGTASWALNALTASYVSASAVIGLDLFRIITGSITASVNITPENLFLIKSGSITYFNISSSGDTEIYSDKFEVRNFTTKQPVLTVSQSIVQFATHSLDPSGSTNAGSIWFTSTAMYVGLD